MGEISKTTCQQLHSIDLSAATKLETRWSNGQSSSRSLRHRLILNLTRQKSPQLIISILPQVTSCITSCPTSVTSSHQSQCRSSVTLLSEILKMKLRECSTLSSNAKNYT